MTTKPHKKALESIGKLSEFKLERMSINKHDELLERVDEQFVKIHLKAEAAYEKFCTSLEESDPDTVALARKESAKLKAQIEDLEDLKKKIEDSITQKKIRQKMAERLGGHKVLRVFEIFIKIHIGKYNGDNLGWNK